MSKEKELPLKSELLNQQKELNDKNEILLKEMQERSYSIKFEHAKIYTKLLKFLEKDAPWGHTNAAGLIMLYHNLKEQKDLIKSDDWDGTINLRSANVSILWQMLTRMTGVGFYQAKDFIELMATIGETVSLAHNQVIEDNAELRQNHQDLAMVDQKLDGKEYVDDDATVEEVE
jgi:hypothetical protein